MRTSSPWAYEWPPDDQQNKNKNKGPAPVPALPEIKQTKFSMIGSSLFPTLIKDYGTYLKNKYPVPVLLKNEIFLVRKKECCLNTVNRRITVDSTLEREPLEPK